MSYTLLDNRDKDLINQDINKVSEQYNIKNKFGSSIVINDSADFSFMGMKLYGKTTQVTTSGKNLLNTRGLNPVTTSGVTITPVYDSNGNLEYLNVNGKSTGIVTYTFANKPVLVDGDYIVSTGFTGGSNSTIHSEIRENDAWKQSEFGTGATFTAVSGNEYVFRIVISSGYTANNLKLYPMIRLASITDGTYEPYTGGLPSPNPQYKQDLVSKGKWGNLVSNENIMSYSDDFDTSERNATFDKPYTGYLNIALYPISGNSQVNVRFYYADGTNGNDNGVLSSSGANNTWHNTNIYVENVIGIKLYNVDGANVRTLGKLLVRYGSYSSVSDSDYRPYSGQKEVESVVYEKNLLENTGKSFTSIYGVDFKVNNDGSVTVNGTNSHTGSAYCSINNMTLKKGKYILSGSPSIGASTKTYVLNIIGLCNDLGNGVEFEITEETEITVRIIVYSGVTVNNLTFYPMIRKAEITDETYVPYTKQSHISLVGDGLKGIPVTKSSLATYTDENGQMYCSDVKDYAKSVNKQNIERLVLDGTEKWIKYGTNQYGISNSDSGALPNSRALCSHYRYSNYKENNTFYIGSSGMAFQTEFETAIEWKAFLAEQYANGTPVTVDYILATPIETPLTASEIASFKALHSNYKVTSVMNDCEAKQDIKYAGAAYESGLTNVINKSIDNKVGDIDSKVLINGADYGIERIQIEETDGQLQLVFRAADGTRKGAINFDLAATTTE